MLKKLSKTLTRYFSSPKFIAKRDPYQSLQVYMGEKATPQQVRTQILTHEFSQKQKKTNAIWIFLNQQNLQHVGFIVNQLGYQIHHGRDNRIALYKWLSNRSDLVPPYSNFYISCGAVVIDNQHLLMVQESNGPRKGLFGIPGGRSDVGEFLQKTAQRQLFEQTGVVAKFQHYLYFRLMQNTVFGADDLYFVCLMKAQQESLRKIKLCDRELTSFEWIHLSKLQQFTAGNTVGTQKEVCKYLSQLYKKGYKFQTQNPDQYPNISRQHIFTRSFDGVHRRFKSCRLINVEQQKDDKVV